METHLLKKISEALMPLADINEKWEEAWDLINAKLASTS
jgi:hypothetical protein